MKVKLLKRLREKARREMKLVCCHDGFSYKEYGIVFLGRDQDRPANVTIHTANLRVALQWLYKERDNQIRQVYLQNLREKQRQERRSAINRILSKY
jgi:hypothetical protein